MATVAKALIGAEGPTVPLLEEAVHLGDSRHHDSKMFVRSLRNFCGGAGGPVDPVRTTRARLITAAVAAITFAAIPAQLPACYKLVLGDETLEILIGIGVIPGNYRVTSKPWSAIQMVASAITLLDSAEGVGASRHSLPIRVARVAGSIIIGSLAYLPNLFILRMLGESWALTLSTIPESIATMYSSYLVLGSPRQYIGPQVIRNLFGLRAEVVGRMKNVLLEFIRGRSDKMVADLEGLKTDPSTDEVKVGRMFHLLIGDELPKTDWSLCEMAKTGAALALAVSMTLVQLYFTAIPTADGLASSISNKVALYAIAAFTCLASIALLKVMLFDLSYKIVAFNLLNKKGREVYIGERLRPQTSRIMKAVSIALPAAVGWTASYSVAHSYLPGPVLGGVGAAFLGTSQSLLSYYVLRLFTEWGLEEWLIRFGREEEKRQMAAYRTLSDFVNFVETASPESLAKFLLGLDSSETIDGMLARHNLTWPQLKAVVEVT